MIDLVPLSQFSERYAEGWRLVEGYDLAASDYAATMASPDHQKVWKSSRARAATSRNLARYQPDEAVKAQVVRETAAVVTTPSQEQLEILEEENRQLKERIEQLSGFGSAEALQYMFRLTPAESRVMALLVHRGSADHDRLENAAYTNDRVDEIGDVVLAIRSHIKRIRRKIRPHGLDIVTVFEFGYEMKDDARAAVRKMIADWRARFDA